MPIVFISKEEGKGYIGMAKSRWPDASRIGFCYPDTPAYMGQTWNGGVFSLVADNGTRALMYCRINNFTAHCGIRSITGLAQTVLGAEMFFLKGLESYMRAGKYSLIIGSDGQQTGERCVSIIRNYGRGWTVRNVGINQRVVGMKDQMCIYSRYLDFDESYLPLDWDHPEVQ